MYTLLRAGLHANYLNAAQKPIEVIDTYLFVGLTVCGAACTLLGMVQHLI